MNQGCSRLAAVKRYCAQPCVMSGPFLLIISVGSFPGLWQLPRTHVRSVLKGRLHSSPALSCAALSSPLLCPANSNSLGLPDPQLHLFNSRNWPGSSGFPSLSSDLGTFLGQLARALVGLTSLAACVSQITVLCCLYSGS